MAPQLHWTRDPRCNHPRNPPAWYHRWTKPFWTPRPAARMEKQTAEESKRQWLWHGENTPCESASLYEVTCFPCGVYSRTSQRLNAALGSHDAIHIPNEGCCTPDCFQFALCLPFYGCLLAKLQGTVRSFYDIDGNDVSDWLSGCICPCVTLVRNENEIILRERHQHGAKNSHDHESSANEQYQPQSPMDTRGPWSCRSRSPALDLEAAEADAEARVLTSIPEGSREASTASILSRCVSRSESRPIIESDDALVCADAGGPKTHQLGQDTQLAPIEVKSDTHNLDEDPATLTNIPPVVDTSHDIALDSTVAQRGPREGHSIELDQLESSAHSHQPSKHVIHRDQIVPGPRPATLHDLHGDLVTPPSRDRGTPHTLEEDQLRLAQQGRGGPHSLEADQPTRSRVATRRPHQLRDDK